jgi:hypothetical protein
VAVEAYGVAIAQHFDLFFADDHKELALQHPIVVGDFFEGQGTVAGGEGE